MAGRSATEEEDKQMREDGPFSKQVYIRLTEDGTGFLYTMTYGWLRLPVHEVPLFQEGEKPFGVEAPVSQSRGEDAARKMPQRQAERDGDQENGHRATGKEE
jgi:hypothetical protein